MRIPVERAAYLGEYLSKERPECFKGWRLWTGFGDWEWTKVKDVLFDCAFTRIYRACKAWLGRQGDDDFFGRMRLVSEMDVRTIVEGWEPGCGPDGKSYAECLRGELLETS